MNRRRVSHLPSIEKDWLILCLIKSMPLTTNPIPKYTMKAIKRIKEVSIQVSQLWQGADRAYDNYRSHLKF